MAVKYVEVTIHKNGKVDFKVSGVKGPGCLALTADLIKALGNVIESQELLRECHEQPLTESTNVKPTLRQGT